MSSEQNDKYIDEELDVENEEGNENVVIEVPFNPNDIKITTQPLTLGDIIERLQYGEINLTSDFQRSPDLWDNSKKSRLIESILLKLPIPTFYFDGKDDNKWEVIDGLQRISTLKSFVIDKNLRLRDLQFLKDYNGENYDSLPRGLQRRIKTFPITVYILEKGTPDEVKYNIFSRLNQGGLVLNPQELRNALHQGKPSKLVAELVRSKDEKNFDTGFVKKATTEGILFSKVTGGQIKSKRMEDRDFSTRFVSFYLIDYKKYTPDLNTFMSKGMKEINNLSEIQINTLKFDYRKALNTAYDIFGDDAFRKRFKKEDNRKPINKALFEILTVSFAKLSEQDCFELKSQKRVLKKKLMQLHNNEDGKFLRSISQGTAIKENVIQRFSDIEKIISETLNDI